MLFYKLIATNFCHCDQQGDAAILTRHTQYEIRFKHDESFFQNLIATNFCHSRESAESRLPIPHLLSLKSKCGKLPKRITPAASAIDNLPELIINCLAS